MARLSKEFINKFLKILTYISLFALFILLAVTMTLNISLFTNDSNRLAENVVREVTQSLNKYMDGVAKEFEDYNELCASYKDNDQYSRLLKKLEEKAKEKNYLGFTIKTTYTDKNGGYKSTNGMLYESANREYIDLAINQKRPLYFLHFNNLAKELCMSYYYPMDNGNSIKVLCGIKSFEEMIGEIPEIKDILLRYECRIFFMDTSGYPSYGFIKIEKNKITTRKLNLLEYLTYEFSPEFEEQIKDLYRYEFNTIEIEGQNNHSNYTLTKSSYGQGASAAMLMEINKNDLLFLGRGDFSKVLVSLILTLIMFVASIVLLFLKWKKLEKKDEKHTEYVDELNCSSFAKFEKDAEEHILNDRSVFYSTVTISVANIKFVAEKFGKDVAYGFRKYASKTISSVMKRGETYCWLEIDAFLLLISCTTKAECISKISLITGLLDRYDVFKRNNFSVNFNIGIYFIKPSEKIDIAMFSERSNIAMNANSQSTIKKYTIYDEKIYEEYQVQSVIESKMDSALKHEDFHIFFQPKYNIKEDRIDGAESLVRWYDKEHDGFIRPDRFIKVFEMNGFINKLDRYVFIKVCEFLSQAVKSGMRTTPISVNVSRFTAIQNDFIAFYRETKRKYNIPNNYITIEFTESFSFEDMDVLSKIVHDLKECGFQCSIDDFGSGYSSCGMLKSLDMDELKLDMFLLKESGDEEKDVLLVENMVNLGKAFNMKVTQEGVETMEQLEVLKKFGCDVIQGFLYSKPIIANDFLNFVNGKTDLKTAIENNEKSVYKPINYVDFID